MTLDPRTIRKVLMTAVVAALATSPVAAEARSSCYTTPQHYGLFCNGGQDIEVCESGGECTVGCGSGTAPAVC